MSTFMVQGNDGNEDGITKRLEHLERQMVYVIENVNSLNKKEDEDSKSIKENKKLLGSLKKGLFVSLNVVYMGRGRPRSSDEMVKQDNVPSALECILFCKKVREEKGNGYNVAQHYGGYVTSTVPQQTFPPYCSCLKNAKGYTPHERFASFKFV